MHFGRKKIGAQLSIWVMVTTTAQPPECGEARDVNGSGRHFDLQILNLGDCSSKG